MRSPTTAAAPALRAVGIVALIIDAAMIFGSDHYYRALLFLGIGLPPLSLWVIVTGRAGTRNEPKPPLWWWIGTVIVVLICVAVGVAAMKFLEG